MKASKFVLLFIIVATWAFVLAAAACSSPSVNPQSNVGNRGVNSPSSGNATTNTANAAANHSGH